MLIRCTIENYLSFNDRVEFSMIPGNGRSLKNHIILNKGRNDFRLLKLAAIYGANASGKSNLVKAISFAKQFIIKNREEGATIPLNKFRLDDECKKKPARFEFEIKSEGKSYAYGFMINSDSVKEEWLYEINSKKDTKIYTRKVDSKGKSKIEFSIPEKYKSDKDLLQNITLGVNKNLLLLKFLKNINLKNLKSNVIESVNNVYYWFDKTLTIIFPESQPEGFELLIKNSDKFNKNFNSILERFDTGVLKLEAQEVKEDNIYEFLSMVPKEIVEDIISNLKPNKMSVLQSGKNNRYIFEKEKDKIILSELKTKHKKKLNNGSELFDLKDESDGTLRIMDLIPVLIDIFVTEKVYIIDEIDRSLHPDISKRFLDMYIKTGIDKKGQLIFTTHETGVLDLDFLRKDEIWFVEKNKDGESTLYSLEEFKPRKDKDIRKGYLLGRYGAIPFKYDIGNLGWVK